MTLDIYTGPIQEPQKTEIRVNVISIKSKKKKKKTLYILSLTLKIEWTQEPDYKSPVNTEKSKIWTPMISRSFILLP